MCNCGCLTCSRRNFTSEWENVLRLRISRHPGEVLVFVTQRAAFGNGSGSICSDAILFGHRHVPFRASHPAKPCYRARAVQLGGHSAPGSQHSSEVQIVSRHSNVQGSAILTVPGGHLPNDEQVVAAITPNYICTAKTVKQKFKRRRE